MSEHDPIPEVADLAAIQRILPHRHPFLLVDRVEDIVPGTSATGIKCVTATEPHFTGHFPGRPIMPGVLIVEAMAQTAGVLVGVSERLYDSGMLIYFMAIEKTKFRDMVVPGDVLRMEVEVVRAGSKILRFKGRAMKDGKLAAEAEFTAMIDRPAA